MPSTYTGMNWWYVGRRMGGDPFPTSRADDYLHFLQMIANDGVYKGKRVLSEEAIREMQADQVRGASVEREYFLQTVRGSRHNGVYGLGEWREVVDAEDNALRLSSPSYLGSYPWIDKQRGIYGVFFGKTNEQKTGRDGAVVFYQSPVLSDIVADVIDGKPTQYDFTTLHSQIQQWVAKGYYPGAGLVIAKDGRVIDEQYFGGYNDDTVVYIASAGKWLAAATIAAVVDEGKLSWDDPAGKWVHELKDDPKGKATLRQLVSHTSGYPDYQPEGRPRDAYQTLAESVEQLAALPMEAKPGEKFRYGGLAMQVAGRMAELATGEDFESLFQSRIAKPLRMTGTHFTPVDQAPGHAPMLGGAARTNLRDYSRFLHMLWTGGLYNGKRVLSEQAISEMQADHVHDADTSDERYIRDYYHRDHNGIYGLGEWRPFVDEHGNATLIISPSWAGAYPWIDKTRNVYGFFLAHVDTEAAAPDNFSAFYTSPIIPALVGSAIDAADESKP